MLKTGIVRSVAYATGVSCGESDDIGFFQFLSYDIMLWGLRQRNYNIDE